MKRISIPFFRCRFNEIDDILAQAEVILIDSGWCYKLDNNIPYNDTSSFYFSRFLNTFL